MSLIERIRAVVTLTKFQAIVGITAGFLSIGATVWVSSSRRGRPRTPARS
jgi:hypothetical protein